MELYSTWYYDENEERIQSLSIDSITPELKRSEHLYVISAYYGVGFLENLLNKINKTKRKKCIIKFIFNGLSGQRLYEQIKELKTLKKSLLLNGFSQINIYLNKKTSLLQFFDISNKRIKSFSTQRKPPVSAKINCEKCLIGTKCFYKILLGPVENAQEAKQLLEQLAKHGFIQAKVIVK